MIYLWDPVGFTKNASPEKKERGRLIEINNGRLAMLGLFGFLSESKVPGSVPALGGIALPYDGDYMAPFAADFHIFQAQAPEDGRPRCGSAGAPSIRDGWDGGSESGGELRGRIKLFTGGGPDVKGSEGLPLPAKVSETQLAAVRH